MSCSALALLFAACSDDAGHKDIKCDVSQGFVEGDDGKCICDNIGGNEYVELNGICVPKKVCNEQTEIYDTATNDCLCEPQKAFKNSQGLCEAKPASTHPEAQKWDDSTGSWICDGLSFWESDPNNSGKCRCIDGYVNMKDGQIDAGLTGNCEEIAKCGAKQKLHQSTNTCICDVDNNWLGEAPDCTCNIASGNYVLLDDGNTCAPKPTCGPKQKYQPSTNTCICDIDNNWQGEAPDCTCDTASGNYVLLDDGNICAPTTTCNPLKEIYQSATNTCDCNTEENWLGTAPNCTCGGGDDTYGVFTRDSQTVCEKIVTCNEDGQAFNSELNSCYCNATKHWTDGAEGACKCDDEHRVNDSGSCVCDADKYWVEGNGSCVCDADKYRVEDNGSCVCDSSSHRIEENNICVCDAKNNWYEVDGQCIKCDGILFNNQCTNKGQTVLFGQYRQATEAKDPISWVVLDVVEPSGSEPGRMLLLSEYIIDVQPYNTAAKAMTWENSTLRAWLNDTFMNAAFELQADRDLILSREIDNPDNACYDIPGGNSTTDSIFLLSLDEASMIGEKTCITGSDYFSSEEGRKAKATSYAVTKQVDLNKEEGSIGDDGKQTCANAQCTATWWLRSQGQYTDYAAFVRLDGTVVRNGQSIKYKTHGVRPAMWVRVD